MFSFVVQRPSKYELVKAIIDLEKRGFEVAHQIKTINILPKDKHYDNVRKKYMVKMKKVEKETVAS